MKKNLDNFIDNNFGISVFCILNVAFILRFYDYLNRFGLAYDQAHDAIVARFAIENGLIPLVGPFSSAGPFQTGGTWYYFIMSGFNMITFTWIAPWIFMTLIYILFVYLIIIIGKGLVDKPFGLIVGTLAAVSTAQIAQSTNLANQGPEAIISLLAIWGATSWIVKKKKIYLFALGFFVSLGISIHMQAAALILLIPLAIIFAGIKNLRSKSVAIVLLGLFIPHIPLLIFDFQNDFVNLRGMIQYVLYDQYKISLDILGRRWLTYAGVFWPTAWGHIIGGQTLFGYFTIFGVGLMLIFSLLTRKISKLFLFLFVSFSLMVAVLRYVRTPLFDSYLVFLNPFVLLISAWLVHFIFSKNRIFGVIVFLLLVSGSFIKDFSEITHQGTKPILLMIEKWKVELDQKYPGKNFSFFDYRLASKDASFPFVYYMYSSRKTSDDGLRIGIAYRSDEKKFSYDIVAGKDSGYNIFYLDGSQEDIEKAGWFPINPSYVYNSTENWRKLEGK